MRKLLIPFMLTALLASCNKYDTGTVAPVEIALKALIADGTEETKAPFELSVPTAENPLTAAVWASTTSKSYAGSQTTEPGPEATEIDYHNSTCFTSKESQLLDHKLFYPSKKAGETEFPKVYFVAFCPRSESGWQVDPEKVGSYNIAQHRFDGKTDVMYAPEVSNSLDHSSEQPQFTFWHILTWLKFQVVAANTDAINAWGDLEYIKVKSEDQVRINVKFKDVMSATEFLNTDGKNILPTYIFSKGVSTDQVFDSTLDGSESKSIELTTTAQQVSYVLCAPVKNADSATKEYTVYVKTKYRPETQVEIDLNNAGGSRFTGDTAGKQFTVTLQFNLGDKVVTTATVSSWENGGIGVHQFTE